MFALQTKKGKPKLGRMVMELLAASLADVLHDRQDPSVVLYLQNLGGKLLTASGKEAIVIGVAHGMMYLHTLRKRITHRDLKPANVLLDDKGTPKICDFVRSPRFTLFYPRPLTTPCPLPHATAWLRE